MKTKACIDCDKYHYETFSFMVKDEIWQEAGLNPKDKICVSCLSRRLNRNLQSCDFTAAKINIKIFDLINHFDKQE